MRRRAETWNASREKIDRGREIMAFRLGEYVVYGELRNKKNYSTHGIIVLRGKEPGGEKIVHVELTGNCDADLRGKAFRFFPSEADAQGPAYDTDPEPRVRDQQIGPTGTMTAQGWVRTLPCSVEEFMRRSKLGEPPPTPWKRRLYLEWYGQNGRVVVEMADPLVEECVRESEGDEDEGDWVLLPNLALPPESVLGKEPRGPDITIMRQDGEDTNVEKWSMRPESTAEEEEEAGKSIPDELQRQLDRESAAIERAIHGMPESPGGAGMAEMELMDACIEEGEGRAVVSLLSNIEDFPRPDGLSDEEVETHLKVLLGHMALINVALNVCEHFSPRDCYALLLDTILPDEESYEELIGSGWVQHFMTHEYCDECSAECEEEGLYEED